MNILFVHVAEHATDRFKTNLIPSGVLGLSDRLHREGHRVEILHKELEERLDPRFDLIDYIRKHQFSMVCFDLYFHRQSASVIDLVCRIKLEIPETIILLGGLTASIFAEEILTSFPAVDYILQGDSEIPILQLVDALHRGSDPGQVANLYFRANRQVKRSRGIYVIDNDEYKKTRYSNYSLLKNHDYYLRMRMGSPELKDYKQTYYSVGRSCNKNCTFCGASRSVEAQVNNHKRTILKGCDSVVEDLKALSQYGVTHWNAGFDPIPNLAYFADLFRSMREADVRLSFIFDSFGLPNLELVDEINKTFVKPSIINISPYSGSRKVRIANKTGNFTNEDLFNTLSMLKQNEVLCSIYFSAGLYGETEEDVRITTDLILSIRQEYPEFRIYSQIIEIEPLSLLLQSPSQYVVENHPKSFMDYYRLHKEGRDIAYDIGGFSFSQIKETIKQYNEAAA